jgi:hypothetical protein
MDSPHNNVEIGLAELGRDLKYIKEQIGEIKDKMEHSYVTVDQFEPVKRIAYGVVGLILIAVVGSLMTLVINK